MGAMLAFKAIFICDTRIHSNEIAKVYDFENNNNIGEIFGKLCGISIPMSFKLFIL